MADGYEIDLGELGTLVDTLEHAEESMNNANNALKDASPTDLGSAHLDRAGADFQDKWEYGIGKLAELADKMVGGLKATQKDYQNAEDAIAKLFPAPGGSGGGGSGGGGSDGGGSGEGGTVQPSGADAGNSTINTVLSGADQGGN